MPIVYTGNNSIVVTPLVPLPTIGAIVPSVVFTPATGSIIRVGPHQLQTGSSYEFVEISISRSLDNTPSGSATYYSLSSDGPQIGSPITLFGIPFKVESINIRKFLSTNPEAYSITLNLISIYASSGEFTPENSLDLPIKLPSSTTTLTWDDISPYIGHPVTMGATQYKHYYAGDAPVILTPREEIESAFLLTEKFMVVYSEPTIKGINPLIGEGEIELDFNYVLSEILETNTKQPGYYSDTEVTLEEQIDTEEDNDNPESIVRAEYENCTSLLDLASPIPSGFPPGATAEFLANELKDPGNCFDNGGRTKVYRVIQEIDGNPVIVTERIYGYVFNSIYTVVIPTIHQYLHEVTGNSVVYVSNLGSLVQQAWRKVEENTTTYSYDSDGYLVRSVKQGRRIGRSNRESGSLETFYLQFDLMKNLPTGQATQYHPAFKILREMQSYCFYTLSFGVLSSGGNQPLPSANLAPHVTYTILERTDYYLSRLDDYYTDVEQEDGEPPAKFVGSMRTYSSDQEITPNPRDDPEDPDSPFPPLVIQKQRTEFTHTHIICPASDSANKRKPELFATSTYVQSIEGDFSANSIKMGNASISAGRPSQQTKLPSSGGGGSSGGSMPIGGPIPAPPIPPPPPLPDPNAPSSGGSTSDPDDEEDEPARYFINPSATALASSNPLALSSVSFNAVTTTAAATLAAQNTLLKSEIYSHTLNVAVESNRYQQIKEGNIVFISGQKWLVLQTSVNYTAIAPYQFTAENGIELLLGLVPSTAPTVVVQAVT